MILDLVGGGFSTGGGGFLKTKAPTVSHIEPFLDSERSDECIGFTMTCVCRHHLGQ